MVRKIIILAVFALSFLFFSQSKEAMAQGCGFDANNDWICQGGGAPGNPFPVSTGTSGGTGPTSSGGWPVASGQPVAGPTINNTPPNTSSNMQCGGGNAYQDYLDHLKLREGVRNCVYRDSLGKPTVGVGHLVLPADGLNVGDCISDAQVDAFLQKDAQNAWNAANNQASSAGISDPCFIVALGSVNFQLGTGWTKKFPNTWNMIKNGQYCQAKNALNGTLWQKQTPVRVADFQSALSNLNQSKNGSPCP